jgi:choline dehydrogenase-like flavoprotein
MTSTDDTSAAAAEAVDAVAAPTVLESVLNVELPGGAEVEVLPLLRPVGELLRGRARGDEPQTMLVALQNPESRGRIRLSPDDVHQPAPLEYGYLDSESDRRRMRAAVRLGIDLLETNAFRAVATGPADLDHRIVDDDDRLDAWIAANLATALHLCGSAPMGVDGATGAVTDAHGRVRGVTGLRVADLSILPKAPRRGPAATAVLIGERIAAFMRSGG